MPNAIILAAGLGSRLQSITKETPKPLVKINGQPVIERQIQFLREAGITEIYIVTGYLSHLFEYLSERYAVHIIHNPYYQKYNNLYSLFLARDVLHETYILDGDIFIRENFLNSNITRNTYFSAYKQDPANEWILEFDQKLQNIYIASSSLPLPEKHRNGAYIISGISYWNPAGTMLIKQSLLNMVSGIPQQFGHLFWDQIILDNFHSMDIQVQTLPDESLFEIDTQEDLSILTASLLHYRS